MKLLNLLVIVTPFHSHFFVLLLQAVDSLLTGNPFILSVYWCPLNLLTCI